MNSVSASLQYFEHDGAGQWHKTGKSTPAVLGRSGIAWSWAFKQLAGKGEPIKKEGDGRTPAGFFKVGKPFGFSPAARADYTQLKKGEQFCVDDPGSPHYNAVVPRSKAGKAVSGEDMATIQLYREGLFLNYPTNAEARGGSCIFVHVWRSKNTGTVGCVALAEDNVKELQRRTAGRTTVIAILPGKAWANLQKCFPGIR